MVVGANLFAAQSNGNKGNNSKNNYKKGDLYYENNVYL